MYPPRGGSQRVDVRHRSRGLGHASHAGAAAGIAAFGGLIVSAGPGRYALNIDQYVAAADPAERDAVRSYLERRQRPQGIAALRQKWHGDLPTSVRPMYVLTTADTLVPPALRAVSRAHRDDGTCGCDPSDRRPRDRLP